MRSNARPIYIWMPVLAIFSLSSCVTLLCRNKISLRTRTEGNIKVLSVDNSIRSLRSEYFLLMRSKESLKINVLVDSVPETIIIPPRKSLTYWANILNLGAGFIVDQRSPKKYVYPRRILIQQKDASFRIRNYKLRDLVVNPAVPAGTIKLSFTLPYFNSFYVRTNTGHYPSQGFLGLGLGLSYFHHDNKYIALNAGASTNFEFPVPLPIDYIGGRPPRVGVQFISIRNHHIYGKFDIGYGFHYSESNWSAEKVADFQWTYYRKKNKGFGPSLSVKYHFARILSLGVIYQPTLIDVGSAPVFDYQDFVTLELAANLKIRRPRR